MGEQEVHGDLWRVRRARDWLVIPVSIGWKSDGTALLGRGVVGETARKLPDFALWWGRICRAEGAAAPVSAQARWKIIAFPTRPLQPTQPHLSWRGSPNLHLIQRSTDELLALVCRLPPGGRLLLPVEAVAGTLDRERVDEVLRGLTDNCERVALVYTGTTETTRGGLPTWVDDALPDDPPPESELPSEGQPVPIALVDMEDPEDLEEEAAVGPGEITDPSARLDPPDDLTALIGLEDTEQADLGGWDDSQMMD